MESKSITLVTSKKKTMFLSIGLFKESPNANGKTEKAPFEEPEDGSITKSSPGIRLTSPIFSKHADGKVFTFIGNS